jgi:hypothetical protein
MLMSENNIRQAQAARTHTNGSIRRRFFAGQFQLGRIANSMTAIMLLAVLSAVNTSVDVSLHMLTRATVHKL